MTLVKICGLRSESELEAASCADFIGFVVEADSKRRLSPDRARELMDLTCNRKVMVTTCSDVDDLLRLAGRLEPNVVQLNAVLPEAEMRRLRTELGSDLWALYPLVEPLDLGLLSRIGEQCDRIVLDTPSERGGGSGKVHDWKLSRSARDQVAPQGCVLAGGLSPSNVVEAIRSVVPEVVDVSTGVEREGWKSAPEIERFVMRAWSVR
jgi:phosphoribosylanthranilate isomerase